MRKTNEKNELSTEEYIQYINLKWDKFLNKFEEFKKTFEENHKKRMAILKRYEIQ